MWKNCPNQRNQTHKSETTRGSEGSNLRNSGWWWVHVGTPLHQPQLAIWANCGQSYVIGCGTWIFPPICASPTKPFFSSIKLRTYSSFLFSYFFPWAQFSFSLTIKLLKAFVQVLFMAEENAMWVILVVHVVWWWDWFGFKEQWGSGWL